MSETSVAASYYDVFEVPLEKIYLDSDFNCRGEFSSDSVESLAKSIAEEQLKTPIVLQPMSDVENPVEGFEFRIIAGHRRFKAFERLGRQTIPAFIRLGEAARKAHFENFIENAERENLSIVAEARWIRSTFPSTATLRDIAKIVNRSPSWVRVRLRLLELPEWVLDRAEDGELSVSDITVIVSNHNPTAKAREILRAKATPNGWRQSGRRQPKKPEIQQLMKRLLREGYAVQFTQLLGWAIGEVTDEVLEEALLWLETKKPWLR